MRSIVAAHEMDSQKVTRPLTGMTTTRPGSVEEADGDTKDAMGRGSVVFLDGYGSAKLNVSGEGVVDV
jgi:hypothetical protein